MPLSGVICCQTGLPTSFEHCQMCSLNGSCVFARPLIDEMAGKTAKRSGVGVSATDLLGCPRFYAVGADTPYFESPADYHARWRGTGIHAMAQAYGPYPGVVQERRIRLVVETPSGEATLTGQPDWFDAERRYLEDWKSTTSVPKTPYDDHKAQLNIYAMLIEEGLYDPLDASGDILYPDGCKATQNDPVRDYAPLYVETAAIRYIDNTRGPAVPVELWGQDFTRDFVRSKLEPIVRWQKTGELPTGIAHDKDLAWKIRYCPLRGSGSCCADT